MGDPLLLVNYALKAVAKIVELLQQATEVDGHCRELLPVVKSMGDLLKQIERELRDSVGPVPDAVPEALKRMQGVLEQAHVDLTPIAKLAAKTTLSSRVKFVARANEHAGVVRETRTRLGEALQHLTVAVELAQLRFSRLLAERLQGDLARMRDDVHNLLMSVEEARRMIADEHMALAQKLEILKELLRCGAPQASDLRELEEERDRLHEALHYKEQMMMDQILWLLAPGQQAGPSSAPPPRTPAVASFTCPITLETMTDPVILCASGQTYERWAIQRWLQEHDTCPLSGMQVRRDHRLVENHALRSVLPNVAPLPRISSRAHARTTGAAASTSSSAARAPAASRSIDPGTPAVAAVPEVAKATPPTPASAAMGTKILSWLFKEGGWSLESPWAKSAAAPTADMPAVEAAARVVDVRAVDVAAPVVSSIVPTSQPSTCGDMSKPTSMPLRLRDKLPRVATRPTVAPQQVQVDQGRNPVIGHTDWVSGHWSSVNRSPRVYWSPRGRPGAWSPDPRFEELLAQSGNQDWIAQTSTDVTDTWRKYDEFDKVGSRDTKWDELQSYTGRMHFGILPSQLKMLLSRIKERKKLDLFTDEEEVKLAVVSLPLDDSGCHEWSFRARLMPPHKGVSLARLGGEEVVIKLFKHGTREGHTFEAYIAQMEIHTVAAALAKFFAEACKAKAPSTPELNHLRPTTFSSTYKSTFLVCNVKPTFKGVKMVKFTNDAGYVNTDHCDNPVFCQYADALSAFSHWCFQVSKETLMVTDQQGIDMGIHFCFGRYYFCDPAIHCPTDVLRFGSTNLGESGMDAFFMTHICNDVCKKLGLHRHSLQPATAG